MADADKDIRRAVVLRQYQSPAELIDFLSNIYGEHRFDNLVEVRFRGGVCCCIVQPDLRYIREDYFSSGEYFLINLYRKVLNGKSFVVIDEIDISLDASAQVRLAHQLRRLCAQHRVTVVFTSHSLALMQTLEPGELYYLERTEDGALLAPMSFNSVKSLMFGFKGWDRYILTEDEELKQFLEYVISHYCPPAFFSYRIIKVAGGPQVTDLMRRNRQEEFLGPEEHVISVLDGDQARADLPRGAYCLPLLSVEKALWNEYHQPGFEHMFQGGEILDPKPLYKEFVRSRRLSPEEIFKLLCDRNDEAIAQFSHIVTALLCRPN